MDKELGAQRKNRWMRAFSESARELNDAPSDPVNCKATVVLEHLIQASDVAHTMQHFQVYKKWNSRLYQEMMLAYQNGKSEKDPNEFWYQGEVSFFEHYIIPLAKKLKECGVFGVSSEEYLNYAIQNQQEWISRGTQIVAEFREQSLLQSEHTTNTADAPLETYQDQCLEMDDDFYDDDDFDDEEDVVIVTSGDKKLFL